MIKGRRDKWIQKAPCSFYCHSGYALTVPKGAPSLVSATGYVTVCLKFTALGAQLILKKYRKQKTAVAVTEKADVIPCQMKSQKPQGLVRVEERVGATCWSVSF